MKKICSFPEPPCLASTDLLTLFYMFRSECNQLIGFHHLKVNSDQT